MLQNCIFKFSRRGGGERGSQKQMFQAIKILLFFPPGFLLFFLLVSLVFFSLSYVCPQILVDRLLWDTSCRGCVIIRLSHLLAGKKSVAKFIIPDRGYSWLRHRVDFIPPVSDYEFDFMLLVLRDEVMHSWSQMVRGLNRKRLEADNDRSPKNLNKLV